MSKTVLDLALYDEAEEWQDVGYVRISDDRGGTSLSPARQRRAITNRAVAAGATIHHWFADEGRSAYRAGVVREEFDRLLELCGEKPIRRIWVLHNDRLLRQGDDDDLPRLIKATAPTKIEIKSVESGDMQLWHASGKVLARIMNAVNGGESERKHERVALAAADRASKGQFLGGSRRFGYEQLGRRTVRVYDDDGNAREFEKPTGPLTQVPHEAVAIKLGHAMILSGESVNEVTRRWREAGLVGVHGKVLQPATVRDILLNPMHAGLTSYKGEIVCNTSAWEPIVTEQSWADVTAILTNPGRRTNNGRPAVHLLTGILRCAACGSPMRCGSKREKARGGNLQQYRCRAGRALPPSDGQRHVARSRPKIDAAVTSAVLTYLDKHGKKLVQPRKPTKSAERAIDESIKLQGRIAALQTDLGNPECDIEDTRAALRNARAHLAVVNKRIVTDAGRPATAALIATGDIADGWRALSVGGRRTVLREIVDRIEVGSGGVGAHADPLHNVQAFDIEGRPIEW